MARGENNPVLMPDRFHEEEAKNHRFVVDAEVGVTVEDVQRKEYWAHVAHHMVPFDTIIVRAEDGSWAAFLMVQYAERNFAKVKLYQVVEFEDNQVKGDPASKFRVDWRGPHHKFSVVRLSDSDVVQKGFNTRQEADAWRNQHEATMG